MEQKDFIIREIEKISVMLQYLIGKLTPSKSIKEQQATEKLINKVLKDQYGNGLQFILSINKSDFDSVFSKNKGFTNENIELLADLVFTLGNNEFSKNQNYLLKALELYTYIDLKTKTYSFNRIDKINILKNII